MIDRLTIGAGASARDLNGAAGRWERVSAVWMSELRRCASAQRRPGRLAVLAAATLLSACALPPDDSAVQAQLQAALQRGDRYTAVGANEQILAAATGTANVLVSLDQGRSWKRQPLDAVAAIIGFASCPDGTLVGLDFHGKVWTPGAQGGDWKSQPLDSGFDPLAISCDAGNRLWVVGSHTTVARSDDHGASWQSQELGEDAILRAVAFRDARHGVTIGEFGTVATTQDGGVSWEIQAALPEDFYPYSLSFTANGRAWAAGTGGRVMSSEDSGRSWTEVAGPEGVQILSTTAQGHELYAVGSESAVLRYDGAQWSRLDGAPKSPAPWMSVVAAGRSLLLSGPTVSRIELPV